jgi:putative membrane protein
MSTNEEPKARFEVPATAASHFAWMNTRMALERTLMAWVRTGIALIGFGFTIVQFFQRLSDMPGVGAPIRPQAPRHVGLALIGVGVAALLISLLQYRRLVIYLWSAQFTAIAGLEAKNMKPIVAQTPVMAIVIALILIGLFAFSSVLLRTA